MVYSQELNFFLLLKTKCSEFCIEIVVNKNIDGRVEIVHGHRDQNKNEEEVMIFTIEMKSWNKNLCYASDNDRHLTQNENGRYKGNLNQSLSLFRTGILLVCIGLCSSPEL